MRARTRRHLEKSVGEAALHLGRLAGAVRAESGALLREARREGYSLLSRIGLVKPRKRRGPALLAAGLFAVAGLGLLAAARLRRTAPEERLG